MNIITFEDLCTIVYVLIDDWYVAHGKKLLKGKRGENQSSVIVKSSLYCC